ncbi:carbohydrate kinase family protein, partial [Rubripirellula amarantea]|nr:carbohydrate kinase family protein [Rubripirellula amarantea]
VLIQDAKWVKMSDEELIRLSSIEHCDTVDQVVKGTAELGARYNVNTFLITAGGDGAYMIDNGDPIHAPAPEPAKMADTVGAGDSFAAAMIAGFTLGHSPQQSLDHAVAFASRVCGLSGATTNDRNFYRLG